MQMLDLLQITQIKIVVARAIEGPATKPMRMESVCVQFNLEYKM